MSSWKKMFAGGVAAALAVTMLGCGGTAESGSDAKSEAASAKGSGSKSESEKGGDGPVVIWTQGNSIKEDAEAWGAENGVDVDVVVIPFADLQTKLKQQITDPKTAPDVYAVTKDYVKTGWSAVPISICPKNSRKKQKTIWTIPIKIWWHSAPMIREIFRQ